MITGSGIIPDVGLPDLRKRCGEPENRLAVCHHGTPRPAENGADAKRHDQWIDAQQPDEPAVDIPKDESGSHRHDHRDDRAVVTCREARDHTDEGILPPDREINQLPEMSSIIWPTPAMPIDVTDSSVTNK